MHRIGKHFMIQRVDDSTRQIAIAKFAIMEFRYYMYIVTVRFIYTVSLMFLKLFFV